MAAHVDHQRHHSGGAVLLALAVGALVLVALGLAWTVWSDGLFSPETSRLSMELKIPDALPAPTPMPDPQPTPTPLPNPQPR